MRKRRLLLHAELTATAPFVCQGIRPLTGQVLLPLPPWCVGSVERRIAAPIRSPRDNWFIIWAVYFRVHRKISVLACLLETSRPRWFLLHYPFKVQAERFIHESFFDAPDTAIIESLSEMHEICPLVWFKESAN